MDMIKEMMLENSGLIADVAVAALFLVFGFASASKGLYKTVLPLIILVLAVTAGIAASNLATEAVTDKIWPYVESNLQESLGGITDSIDRGAESFSSSVKTLVKLTGLEEELSGLLGETGKDARGSAAQITALVRKAAEKLVRFLLFTACTLAAIILLKLLSKLLGDIDELPVIKQVDSLGGFILGILGCLAILYVAAKFCDWRGIDFFRRWEPGSRLLSWILNL